MTNQIHPTATIADDAQLGHNNIIGPYAVIEADTELGDNNRIAAHAVIKRFTRMQHGNAVYESAVIGGLPQHTGFTDENVPTFVEIGSHNVFREAVTVNRAYHEGKATSLGDHNFLMYSVHIGHDCQIGNNVTFAPSAGIGGHVSIGDRAFISGGVMVHQFVHIGRLAMVGGNSKITQDVLPFMITDGNPAVVHGLNLVGLKRAGFKLEQIKALKQAYRSLFGENATADSLQHRLASMASRDDALSAELHAFIQQAERGFHRPR